MTRCLQECVTSFWVIDTLLTINTLFNFPEICQHKQILAKIVLQLETCNEWQNYIFQRNQQKNLPESKFRNQKFENLQIDEIILDENKAGE